MVHPTPTTESIVQQQCAKNVTAAGAAEPLGSSSVSEF